jgi:hypothetical protein
MNTARLQHNLGWVLWKQGAYAESEPLLRIASVNIPKTYGPTYVGARLSVATPPPRLRAAIVQLASFYVAAGKAGEAVSWRNRLQGLDASRRLR